MVKRTLYIAKSKYSKSLFVSIRKTKVGDDATNVAKVEITPKIVEKYDKKVTDKRIYELIRRELSLIRWD